METTELLGVMHQCTHQLDDLLQRLRSTSDEEGIDAEGTNHSAADEYEVPDDDTIFEDSFSHPQKLNIPSTNALPDRLQVSRWGTHDEQLHEKMSNHFTAIQIQTSLPRNRIVEAACSRFHTLFLNDMGMVFSYGHSSDGALGLGDQISGYVMQPTLVDFFFDNLIIVQHVACAGDQLTGAHSAAVSQDGAIFTWGVGVALGTGTLKSASTPQRIELTSRESVDTNSSTITARSVSCGSGFCVATTVDGRAFSWGKWGNGRLGLGPIPIIARTSRRRGGGAVRKQFQLFQLYPMQIQEVYSVEGKRACKDGVLFSKVACGDAHCVGLTNEGELVTWGRGNSGQQGRGDACDKLSPTMVLKSGGQMRWRDVAASENGSMALSIDGKVWTWGACGGAVLGHGLRGSQRNALLAETILQRHQRLLSQLNGASTSSASCPTLPRLKWMTPQIVPCFDSPDIHISRLSAGAQHAAAITDTGDLYMWGEGYTDSGNGTFDERSLMLSSLPKLVNSGHRVEEAEIDSQAAVIGSHSVEHVVCGGRQTIAFTAGSFLAHSMAKLYQASCADGKLGETSQANGTAGTDLVMVVSGQRILVHKLLLAQRSPVFRELILDEEQQQRSRLGINEGDEFNHAISATEPMELLLPGIRIDVAQALLEFIYTDDFKMEFNNGSHYLINDVLRAAKLYKIPSLAQLCRERLFSNPTASLFGAVAPRSDLREVFEEGGLSDNSSDEEVEEQEDAAIRTLNDDMKFAVSDGVWADTVLVAEGRSIPVHRCMLIARSEYFRAVLAFHRVAAHSSDQSIVIVEDSYAGIVRILRFIYYDQVALPQVKNKGDQRGGATVDEVEEDGSDQLLEDLVAADKYGLERMKRLCEHTICVTAANCLEVLAIAELVHAAHLKQVALRFLQTHLADITARREEFKQFQEDFPRLLEELYVSLRDAQQQETLLREWYTEVGAILAAQHEEKELQWGKKSVAVTFPWIPLCLAVVFGTMYLSMMHAQEHEYSAVPAANMVAIAAVGGAIMMGYL